MSDQPKPLYTLLVRTAAVLEDVADDVREQHATNDQLIEMADVLAELSAVLRGQCSTYVPPRVIDAERTDR